MLFADLDRLDNQHCNLSVYVTQKRFARFIMRINATRMTTPIEEKIDQKLKVRTGMVAVSDGKSRPVPVRLHLSMEVLRLQKEEVVPPETKPQNAKVSI